MDSFRFTYQWRTAVPYRFPERFTPAFRQAYSRSGVYRWRVLRIAGEEKEPVYIGEAENIVRRMQRVVTPAKKERAGDTSYRLNKIFKDFVAKDRTVVLDIADIDQFELNGQRYGGDTLGDRFKRRALENILLVDAVNDSHVELLNILIDPVEKVRVWLATLPPNQVREIFEKYGPKATKPTS